MPNETMDPRIRRTRKMLQDGLAKLLPEKDFDKISVQDIVDASDLHRTTFYDHYPDKFALLECLVGSRFHELLAQRGVKFGSCDGALKSIALGVCDYISRARGAACSEHRRFQPYMESAIIAVVRRMILEGFKAHPSTAEISPDLIASTVSWAIYGAAKQWAQDPARGPAEQMADQIEKLVSPIFQAAHSEQSAV
jgi:AcrR family transcriptional regulator